MFSTQICLYKEMILIASFDLSIRFIFAKNEHRQSATLFIYELAQLWWVIQRRQRCLHICQFDIRLQKKMLFLTKCLVLCVLCILCHTIAIVIIVSSIVNSEYNCNHIKHTIISKYLINKRQHMSTSTACQSIASNDNDAYLDKVWFKIRTIK